MKIAVNTRLLIKNRLDGIGWFTYETLKRITQAHPEHTFYFLFDRKFSDEFIFSKNIKPIVVHPQARHPFLFYAWFEWSLPYVFSKIKPDLFLSPDGYLSLSTSVPSLGVIHDINFEHYPKDLPFLQSKYYRYYFPKFSQKAQRIATVSEFSKKDIVEKYNIDPGKVDVVFNGANESYKPSTKDEILTTRKKYTQSEGYFLFIGALHPRKNLVNLFKAFDLYKSSGRKEKLLIVGRKMWWTPAIKEAYEAMQFQGEVVFVENVPVEELNKIIGGALAMMYVSYFEGFGIPILEAMFCDVPVITSNITSMPEIGGDAVYLVDPFSPESIREGMLAVSQDQNLRNSLIEKGRERRKFFSWNKTAGLLWDSMEKIIKD